MRCIEDTLQEIDELIILEEDTLMDHQDDLQIAHDCRVAIEVLRNLRYWIMDL